PRERRNCDVRPCAEREADKECKQYGLCCVHDKLRAGGSAAPVAHSRTSPRLREEVDWRASLESGEGDWPRGRGVESRAHSDLLPADGEKEPNFRAARAHLATSFELLCRRGR